MKRYKLLKDLPTFKAGDLFYISEYGALIHDGGDVGVVAYSRQTLEKFPNILNDWFEEIQEPTDSTHWKPTVGEGYWFVYSGGDIGYIIYTGIHRDIALYEAGSVYRTEKEAAKARDRRLAEVRLRRTSNFKPDFENKEGGYAVCYSHLNRELRCDDTLWYDSGEPVRYETKEDALKSIKENREDWLIYFGVDPADTDS